MSGGIESTITALSAVNGQLVTRLIMNRIQLFVGVPGNCLILRVYWTKNLKTSTHVVIMALAWADLAICRMAVTDTVERALQLNGSETPVPVQYIFFAIYACRNVITGFSVMITSIIAADRYDCICRTNRRFFSHKRAKRVVKIAFLIAIIDGGTVAMIVLIVGYTIGVQILALVIQLFLLTVALVMILFCYGKIYRTISNHVKVTFASGPDASGQRPDEKDTSKMPAVVSDTSMLHVSAAGKDASSSSNEICTVDNDDISLTSVAIQTKGPSVKLTSHQVETEDGRVTTVENDQRTGGVPKQAVSRGRPHTSDLQRKTTRMLFITSVIFLLTWMPFGVRVIIRIAEYGGANVSPVIKTIFNAIYYSFLINSAVNPFIYGIANRRFRKDCRDVLRSMKLC